MARLQVQTPGRWLLAQWERRQPSPRRGPEDQAGQAVPAGSSQLVLRSPRLPGLGTVREVRREQPSLGGGGHRRGWQWVNRGTGRSHRDWSAPVTAPFRLHRLLWSRRSCFCCFCFLFVLLFKLEDLPTALKSWLRLRDWEPGQHSQRRHQPPVTCSADSTLCLGPHHAPPPPTEAPGQLPVSLFRPLPLSCCQPGP